MDPASQVKDDPRRRLPSVGRLEQALRDRDPTRPAWARKAAARLVLDAVRRCLADPGTVPTADALAVQALARARALARPHPAPVVNATGVVLHTNLGRAPLAPGAAEAVARAAVAYTDLELERETGRRGDRLGGVSELLCLLSGAEAACVVNNNAAAVLLVANTMARGREVLVSRGELVEIGGSFRVPAIMEQAGVRLVEVGTTNRTHAQDYRAALGPGSALLLKVHRSNFEQRGFVAEVGLGALAEIGRAAGLPVVEDLGSGTLVDLRAQGLPEESFAPARLRQGADLVCFSGDKLLGGPQAGIVLGRRDLVDAARRNPLARALRLDKLDLSALDWTLRMLLEGRAEMEIPVLRQLLEPPGSVAGRARALAERIASELGARLDTRVEGLELPSFAVALRASGGVETLAAGLRAGEPPVLGRVHKDVLLLDARTLLPGDEQAIVAALRRCVDAGGIG
jgi:L-seryl-tRNA(Ser) seleniumtransferase